MSIFTISPIWPFRRTVSHTPYPPPILAKHHTLYSVDPNLFITICGILFGLHHAYFSQSHYFQTIMDIEDIEEPEWPISKGSQALYPLPFDDLNQLSFTWFLSFFYQPRNFVSTKRDWKNIYDYCIDWYLPEHMAIATCKLIDIQHSSFTYAERQTLRAVNLSYEMVHRQQQHWHQLHRQDSKTLMELDGNTFVKDNSA